MEALETVVRVRSGWDSWQAADIGIDSLRGVHWRQPLGAPRPIIHASVDCTDTLARALPHDCSRADGAHRVLVCVLKHDCIGPVYRELAAMADAARRAPLVESGRQSPV